MDYITKFDHFILENTLKIENRFLDIFFINIELLTEIGIIWIIVLLIMFFKKDTRKTGISILFGVLTSLFLINHILKDLINRSRPYEIYKDLNIIVETSGTNSFPSSHACIAFIFVILFNLNNLKYKRYINIIGILTIISRLYFKVHFLSDVIGSGLLALLIVYFYQYTLLKIEKLERIKKMKIIYDSKEEK